jgi:hypothetical protein
MGMWTIIRATGGSIPVGRKGVHDGSKMIAELVAGGGFVEGDLAVEILDDAAFEATFATFEQSLKTVDQLRSEAYDAAGVTDKAMGVALWERDVEGQEGAAAKVAAMEASRQAVKAAHPKP